MKHEFAGRRTVTAAVRKLLDTLDEMSDTEKQEVTAEVLRRAHHLLSPELPEEALVAAAEELFLDLDKREVALAPRGR